ncbi:PepSY domain-containing protein [Streptomyces sp. NPDC059385]|uniref:PepSY domain-containing protein n=1 Tax=Streptomyces sp. NPDC059385 TaxID=3346817 RepID=UPI0036C77909
MKRNMYISAAVSVVLIAGGPVAAAAAATADTARTAPAAAARADVDATGAAEAALKKYPGVVESLDKDGSVWHVDVITKDGKGHAELEVASNGTVTQVSKDTNDDPGEYKALLAAKVNAQQAMKAAVAAHPGQAWAVEWDNDNGATYWHVEVKDSNGKTWNAHVDPTTGKVTASGSDSDSDNND